MPETGKRNTILRLAAFLTVALSLLCQGGRAQERQLPKVEMRGVWVATAYGIDWPKGALDPESQKEEYSRLLDLFKDCGINTVFFQVRSKADAFYESEFEPWSKVLTGTQGKDPGYDVLEFLVAETHRKGMQFHAWINPYRIDTRVSSKYRFQPLDRRIPERLVKDYNRIRIYNPALPQVQDRIAVIVREIVSRYDVDGIHMDDYFYPYLERGEKMDDDREFRQYGNPGEDIAGFRRRCVTEAVAKIRDAIKQTRPEVVFSVSPQGNWRNNYNDLYADVALWAREGLVDVLIPQLYFAEGDFKSCLDWFIENAGQAHLLAGYAAYRFDRNSTIAAFRDAGMLAREYAHAASTGKVEGAVFYNASALVSNKEGIRDVVRGLLEEEAFAPYFCAPPLPQPPVETIPVAPLVPPFHDGEGGLLPLGDTSVRAPERAVTDSLGSRPDTVHLPGHEGDGSKLDNK